MGRLGRVIAAAACLIGSAALPVKGGPVEDGQAAFDAGQMRRAYEIWLPLAEAGDCRAQYGLSQVFSQIDDSRNMEDIAWADRMFKANGLDRRKLITDWYIRALFQGHAELQRSLAGYFRSRASYDMVVNDNNPEPEAMAPEQAKKFTAYFDAYEALAEMWYVRAAYNGDSYAIHVMTFVDEKANPIQSAMWAIITRDDRLPIPDVDSLIEKLRSRLSPAQFAEAERRAADWRAAHADRNPWGSC